MVCGDLFVLWLVWVRLWSDCGCVDTFCWLVITQFWLVTLICCGEVVFGVIMVVFGVVAMVWLVVGIAEFRTFALVGGLDLVLMLDFAFGFIVF